MSSEYITKMARIQLFYMIYTTLMGQFRLNALEYLGVPRRAIIGRGVGQMQRRRNFAIKVILKEIVTNIVLILLCNIMTLLQLVML